MKYKLIVSDLDGTLLNGQKFVSNINKDAIRKAKEQGISGRTMRDVRSRMKSELEYWINEKQENCIRLKG